MRKSIGSQNHIIEKNIQRYIFEKLNYGNRETLKEFFPKSIHEEISNKRIKVIIPEYPLEYIVIENGIEKFYKHNTDFRIIYNDDSFHNVEVEWITSRFNSHSKEVYEQLYKNGKGFIIVFYDDSFGNSKIDYIENKDVKVISPEDFSFWFSLKAKHLVDGTISNYVPNYDPHDRNIWVIYLPGSGANKGNSKNDFLIKGKKRGKWAFRHSLNKGKFMEKILNIYKGDLVIFIWGLRRLNETHQRQANINNDWYVEGIEITRVTKGYYSDINDCTFELEEWKKNKEPEKKNYIHYFNFDKKPSFSSVGETRKFFLKDTKSDINYRNINLENTVKQIIWSHNNQGCPSKITSDDYRALLMHLGVTPF